MVISFLVLVLLLTFFFFFKKYTQTLLVCSPFHIFFLPLPSLRFLPCSRKSISHKKKTQLFFFFLMYVSFSTYELFIEKIINEGKKKNKGKNKYIRNWNKRKTERNAENHKTPNKNKRETTNDWKNLLKTFWGDSTLNNRFFSLQKMEAKRTK